MRDVLTRETAEELRAVLSDQTPWGLAMQADGSQFEGPQQVRPAELQTPTGQRRVQALGQASDEAAAKGAYAFRFAQHSLVQAVQEGAQPDGPHTILLEHLNAPDFLKLARDITGIAELQRADGQATLFGRNHFLGVHNDSHVAEGWRVAYVLNLTSDDWRPDWGGYLAFLDEDGDIEAGYRPRFNALNLFAVPSRHCVTYVPPFAPLGRFAVTGWLRDR